MSAGCSDTPLAKKLGIKSGHSLLLVAAPPGWSVPELPEGVDLRRRINVTRSGADKADVLVAFFTSARQLQRTAAALAHQLAPSSSLWIAWPRKAGGHASDVDEHLVRDTLLPVGVVDVKVAALDDDWSALKFVWRLEHRSARR